MRSPSSFRRVSICPWSVFAGTMTLYSRLRPVRGLRNYWVACGVMAGFCQGGGVGLALSNWMTQGDPGYDIWAMDVARFGDWATMPYTNAKVRENYGRRFSIRFPNEELAAGRPLRTTPVYDRLLSKGAVFGVAFGLEHALWFAPTGTTALEESAFRRSNAFGPVKEECEAVRTSVGLFETSGFAKFRVTGGKSEDWLGKLLACQLPKPGRIALAPMLNYHGKLIGDLTVAAHGPQDFYVMGSGVAEEYYLRWFEQHMPDSGVALRPLSSELLGFSLSGPRSRDLLQRITDIDVGNDAFPFMSFRTAHVGMISAKIGRLSFTGELGYEIWVRADYHRALYDLIVTAGEDLGLRHFGLRALNSLRLEKGFGNWSREFRPDYSPFEAGLDRFVSLEKGDFIGRDALIREKQVGSQYKLVTLTIDANDADAIGDEPIWHDGTVVGWVTSGGYGYTIGKSLALGYIPLELAQHSDGFEVEILGARRLATLSTRAPYDPDGTRMRA